MYRILSRRRLTVLAATGAAAALVSTAASATKVGLPGAPAPVPAPRAAEWATTTTGTGATPEGDGAGLMAAVATCVGAGASRSALSHTYDRVHRTWVVRVARPLCAPLYAQDARYRKPLPGRRDYPQTLQATGRLVRMQAPGTYRVPLLARNSCVQTDTGASWSTPPRWPRTLAAPGVPQPMQLSHWSVGPSTWFSLPAARCAPLTPVPAPKVTVHCPKDCAGTAQVTMSATNPTTWLTLQIAPVLNGRMLHTRVLRLGPGRSGSVTFPARDGDTLTFGYVYSSTSRYPFKPFGHPVRIKCPPGAPPVVVSVACPCDGELTGSVEITNLSRYPLQVAVFVSGVPQAVVAVPPRKTGTAPLTMARRAVATFGFRYNVTGTWPAVFAPIQLTVTASA